VFPTATSFPPPAPTHQTSPVVGTFENNYNTFQQHTLRA
jgi:hypothetical protein